MKKEEIKAILLMLGIVGEILAMCWAVALF